MICFYVPCVWNIRDAVVPADKRVAVFQLQQTTKYFLKDDINLGRKTWRTVRTSIEIINKHNCEKAKTKAATQVAALVLALI